MSIYYQNWEEVTNNWEDEQRFWEEIYIIISDLTSGSNLGIDDGSLNQRLENLEEKKKDRIIEALIKIGNEEYKQKKLKKENISVTVDDIKVLLREFVSVEVEK